MVAVSFFSSFLSSLRTGMATNANPIAQQSNISFIFDLWHEEMELSRVIFLEAFDVEIAPLQRANAVCARLRRPNRGNDRNSLREGRVSIFMFVFTGYF